MKKHLITYVTIIFFLGQAKAQLSANLLLNSRPPTYLSDWGNGRAGSLLITFNAQRDINQIEFFLVTKILNESGEIIAQSNPNLAKTYLINTKTQILRMDQVLQLENLKFSAAIENKSNAADMLNRSGKLPPGIFTLSVEIFQAKTGRPLVEKMNRRFTQLNYTLPYLLSPQNQTWLDAHTAQAAIVFRWSSLVPMPQETVKYRLNVFEILENQTPIQSLRSNMPVLDITINQNTQYIWRPQLDFKSSDKMTFVWSIQTFDLKDEMINSLDENTQGRSEPRVFGICNSKVPGQAFCGENYDWSNPK